MDQQETIRQPPIPGIEGAVLVPVLVCAVLAPVLVGVGEVVAPHGVEIAGRVERIFAVANAQESGGLLKGFGADPRNFHQLRA